MNPGGKKLIEEKYVKFFRFTANVRGGKFVENQSE
jgi:hypothetical protein